MMRVQPIDFRPPKRGVIKVFIHCSASDRPEHDNIATITQWHLERGFHKIGYHYFINKRGEIWIGRDLELTPAAQEGYNAGSIAICVGGLNQFSDEQFKSLKAMCMAIDTAYKQRKLPVTFHGHCEVSNKTCPVFNYRLVVGLDEKGNIKPAVARP